MNKTSYLSQTWNKLVAKFKVRSISQWFGLLVGTGLVTTACLYLYSSLSLKSGRLVSPNRRKTVIAVLGGGLTADGKVPPHTELRLQKALELYKHHEDIKPDTCRIITLSGGTPHKPNPVDSRGFPIWEATAAARRLIELGVPSKHIMEESFSLDTIGNVRRRV